MTSRPRQLRVTRIHGPGHGKKVDIIFHNERLHASGVFSNVYSAIMTSPVEQRIAIKKCWPRNSKARNVNVPSSFTEDREDPNDGKAETELLAQLNHPHIVKLLYSFHVRVEDDVCNCMILDFEPTDLSKILRHRHEEKISSLDIKLYSWQLFAALDFIASKSIAHRDVKPANLLVNDSEGILKLADFGNAQYLSIEKEYPSYQVTRFYRAPELIWGARHYTTKIDTWAGACVLAEMLIGRPMLAGGSNKEQGKQIVDALGYPSKEQIEAMRIERPSLLRKTARGFGNLLPAEIVPAIAVELITGVLRYEPFERLGYDLILGHEYYDQLRVQPPPTRKNGKQIPNLDYWISEESTQETRSTT